MQGMLATQLTTLIHNKILVQDCLVKIKSYMRNQVQGTIICIALDMEVVHNPVPRIGNPVKYVPGSANAASGADNNASATPAPLYNSTNDIYNYSPNDIRNNTDNANVYNIGRLWN